MNQLHNLLQFSYHMKSFTNLSIEKDHVVVCLVVANFAIFACQNYVLTPAFRAGIRGIRILQKHRHHQRSLYFCRSNTNFRLFPTYLPGSMYYLFTSSFSHADEMHVLFNMVGLVRSGIPLLRRIGPVWFLAIYFCSAVGGALFGNHFKTTSWGASCCTYGIKAAMTLIVGINDVNSFLTWIILDTIWTMQCRPGVGWAGHLGGACFGFASAQVVRAFFL